MLSKETKMDITRWLACRRPLYGSDAVQETPLRGGGLETVITVNGYRVRSAGWTAGLRPLTAFEGDIEGLLASLGYKVSYCPECGKYAGVMLADETGQPKCRPCAGRYNSKLFCPSF